MFENNKSWTGIRVVRVPQQKQLMKRLKLFLFVVCLTPVLATQELRASISRKLFRMRNPQVWRHKTVTNNASIAIYHNASTIAFSQVMGLPFLALT